MSGELLVGQVTPAFHSLSQRQYLTSFDNVVDLRVRVGQPSIELEGPTLGPEGAGGEAGAGGEHLSFCFIFSFFFVGLLDYY